MIRVFLENIMIFLIPTLLYAAYVVLTVPASRSGAQETIARVLDEAPYLWLFTAGALLVILCLIAFGSVEGGKPGMKYEPPVFKDGHIEPSHAR
jgi:hypothetical protein